MGGGSMWFMVIGHGCKARQAQAPLQWWCVAAALLHLLMVLY